MGEQGNGRRGGRALSLGWDEHDASSAPGSASGAALGSASGTGPGAVGGRPEPDDGERAEPALATGGLSRRGRRLIAVCAVAALVISAMLVLPRLLGASTGPEQVAREFLQAIVDGDLETVRAHLADPRTEATPGLSAEVLADVEGGVDSFEIMQVTVESRTAKVTVRLRAGSESGTIVLALAATDAGSFSPAQWELTPVQLPEFHLEVPAGVEEIMIEGVAVPVAELIPGERTDAASLVLELLPGTYEVALPGAPVWADVPRIDLDVPLDFREQPTALDAMQFTPDEQTRTEVRRQIDAVLEPCTESTSRSAEECPLADWSATGPGRTAALASPGTWVFLGEPSIELVPQDDRTMQAHLTGIGEFHPAKGSIGGPGPMPVTFSNTAVVSFDAHGDPHVDLTEDGVVVTFQCDGEVTVMTPEEGSGRVVVPADACG